MFDFAAFQALIEQGNLSAAMALLHRLLAGPASERERGEAYGLIGRLHKQARIGASGASSAARRFSLENAIRAYHEYYLVPPASAPTTASMLSHWRREQSATGCRSPSVSTYQSPHDDSSRSSIER